MWPEFPYGFFQRFAHPRPIGRQVKNLNLVTIQVAGLPSPEECVELINAAGNKRKISFAPSSSDIESDALDTIDAIASYVQGLR